MKGIVLAGGSGTRLAPLTSFYCKQLLPVFDKPLIYYPLSVLMLAEIREIMIISTPRDLPLFEKHFAGGEDLGLKFFYAAQPEPRGIAEAFLIAEKFIAEEPVALILGDNIFYAHNLTAMLLQEKKMLEGATIFAYFVRDPQRYGVIEFDEQKRIKRLVEKPASFISSYAVTGLYFYDATVCQKAKQLKPSARRELEITDLNNLYLNEEKLKVHFLSRGTAWLDTGSAETMAEAALFIRTIQQRQNLMIACLEEIAFLKGWISAEQLKARAEQYKQSYYGQYLYGILNRL